MSHAPSNDFSPAPVARAYTLYHRAAALVQGLPPDDILRLPADLRLAYLVGRFRHEFNAVALAGFLYNSTPQLLRRTIDALELIDAPRAADLLRRAARAWCRGHDLPDTQAAYAAFWPLDPATHDALHALARAYDPHAEDLDHLLDRYLWHPALPTNHADA